MAKVKLGASRLPVRGYEPPLPSQSAAVRGDLAGRAVETAPPQGRRSGFLQKIGGLLSSVAHWFRASVPERARLAKPESAAGVRLTAFNIAQTIHECALGDETPASFANLLDRLSAGALRLTENELRAGFVDALNQSTDAVVRRIRDFLTGTTAIQGRALTQNQATAHLLDPMMAAVDAILSQRIKEDTACEAVLQARTAVEHGVRGERVAELVRYAFEGPTVPLARMGLRSDPLEQTEIVCLALSCLEPWALTAILQHARSEDLSRLNQTTASALPVRAAVARVVTERTSGLASTVQDRARSFIPSYDNPDAFVRDLTEFGSAVEQLKAH